jgi:hypothetical protein
MPKAYWIASQIVKGCWKAAGKCANTRRQPIGQKPEYLAAIGKTWQFPFLLSEVPQFCFVFIKHWRQIGKFSELSAATHPNYFLSRHITHSQTQTGATVPLKTLRPITNSRLIFVKSSVSWWDSHCKRAYGLGSQCRPNWMYIWIWETPVGRDFG